jgi:hypothetical protein
MKRYAREKSAKALSQNLLKFFVSYRNGLKDYRLKLRDGVGKGIASDSA